MHTNTASNRSPRQEPDGKSLAERLRAAADLLETIVADRSLLADIAEADRNRLLNAAGRVSRPDALGRRQLLKVVKRINVRRGDEDGLAPQLADAGCREDTLRALNFLGSFFPLDDLEQLAAAERVGA